MSDRATFRGVPFLLEAHELEGGRASVRHSYPLRSEQYIEDLGLRGRAFPVDGYVVGSDYAAQMDAVLEALERPGPGELIHPRYGRRTVQAVSYRVHESVQEQRIARFSVSFEETGAVAPFPSASPAPETSTQADFDAAVAAAEARCEAIRASAAVVSQPSMLATLSSALTDATAAMRSALAPLISEEQALASFTAQVAGIEAQASSLARRPVDVLRGLLSALEAAGEVLTPDFVLALLEAAAFAPSAPEPPTGTSTLSSLREVYDVLLWCARVAPVLQAARLAPGVPWESYDQAVGVRDALLEQLDGIAEEADDDTFAALAQLRAGLMAGVPGAADLPRLANYTPPACVPSILLAYRLYGDTSRELDICARNRVAKPGFVHGGASLEVLSSD